MIAKGDDMTLDGYQNLTARTAIYPGQGSFVGLMYVTGKLNGEAGEVAEDVFKALRDDNVMTGFSYSGPLVKDEIVDGYQNFKPEIPNVNCSFGHLTDKRLAKLKKEFGDVLWYLARSAAECGFTLGEIAEDNINHLRRRHDEGKLHGSGSDR